MLTHVPQVSSTRTNRLANSIWPNQKHLSTALPPVQLLLNPHEPVLHLNPCPWPLPLPSDNPLTPCHVPEVFPPSGQTPASKTVIPSHLQIPRTHLQAQHHWKNRCRPPPPCHPSSRNRPSSFQVPASRRISNRQSELTTARNWTLLRRLLSTATSSS